MHLLFVTLKDDIIANVTIPVGGCGYGFLIWKIRELQEIISET